MRFDCIAVWLLTCSVVRLLSYVVGWMGSYLWIVASGKDAEQFMAWGVEFTNGLVTVALYDYLRECLLIWHARSHE